MAIKIEVDVFSGRRNPSIELKMSSATAKSIVLRTLQWRMRSAALQA